MNKFQQKDEVQGGGRSQIPQQPDGCEDFGKPDNAAIRLLLNL